MNMARSNSPDDESQADDAEGKKQSNRACDYCHRMKMKCIGKENPPCRRCKQGGHQCTFEGPRKTKGMRMEDRLRFVESQMGSMQGALEELLRLQRASLPQSFHAGPSSMIQSNLPTTIPTSLPPNLQSNISTNVSSGISPNLTQITPTSQYPTPHAMLNLESFLNPTTSRPATPREPPAAWSPPPKAPSSDDEVVPATDREWDNMFYLAEAARLESDGHVGPGESLKRKRAPDDFADIKRNLPLERGDIVHRFSDCITLGYCNEEDGMRMYNLFMEGSLPYMPCFDPEIDTFHSLRKRSPFCITTLILVGAKVLDAGGPVSTLQRQCRELAEKIGMSTLFSPVARIEVVQAMIVLASWGDTSWRPGGHALRMAMDMGLYRCLPLLIQSGMGQGKSPAELQEDYPLVVGTRVWLTIFKMEFEMAFNLGRPAFFSGEETIQNCRQFLKHPLSVINDSRLVAVCELLSARVPLHHPFTLIPNASSIPDLDERLIRHDQTSVEWIRYWNDYYESQGVEKGNFLREALISGLCGAELFTNSRILHGIRNKADVDKLPEHRRQRLIKARRSAETLIDMCLRGQQYTKNFAFANLYTHLHIAFAARCLIRLVSLCPEGANVRQIGRDVERVAQVLTRVPGFHYSALLHDVLGKARRQKVLPPASKPASPTPTPNSSDLPHPDYTFDVSPTVEGNPFDFSYAEKLFSGDATQTDWNANAWFPFPPLEEPAPDFMFDTSQTWW